MALPELAFTKDWNYADDFPTVETDEETVRSDIQLLFDEIKDYINNLLLGAIMSEIAAAQTSGVAPGTLVTSHFKPDSGGTKFCVAPHAEDAAKLAPGASITITDGQGHSSEPVVFTGASGITITLPATLVASIVGNVTGNLTGNVTGNVTGDLTGKADDAAHADSADECSGNAATATTAGSADQATKLKNARNFQLTDGIDHSNTGVAVSFNGTANAVIPLPSILHGYLRTAIYGTETSSSAIESMWQTATGAAAPVGALYFVVS